MNPRNEKNCANLDPAFVTMIRSAYAFCLQTYGWAFLVVEGYRSGADQDADFAKGRNRAGQIINKRDVITYARAGASMHQYGLAADCAPYLKGEGGNLNWTPATTQYRQFVAAMETAGMVWGGVWITIADEDHFQMPGLPYTPTTAMQADYKAKLGLPAVWAKLAAGKYTGA